MGDIVNLRTVRKRATRQRDEQRAAANRALHGTAKSERRLNDARKEKAIRDLDQHRIHEGEDP